MIYKIHILNKKNAKMKLGFFSFVFLFLFTSLYAQEQPKEKVIKVEVVKESSFETSDNSGENRIKQTFLTYLFSLNFMHITKRLLMKTPVMEQECLSIFRGTIVPMLSNVVLLFPYIIDYTF